MYSHIVDGKVLDYSYKKVSDFQTAFYIGDILVGFVFKHKRTWSAVPFHPHPLSPLDGFRTRYDASICLLKMENLIQKDCNEYVSYVSLV